VRQLREAAAPAACCGRAPPCGTSRPASSSRLSSGWSSSTALHSSVAADVVHSAQHNFVSWPTCWSDALQYSAAAVPSSELAALSLLVDWTTLYKVILHKSGLDHHPPPPTHNPQTPGPHRSRQGQRLCPRDRRDAARHLQGAGQGPAARAARGGEGQVLQQAGGEEDQGGGRRVRADRLGLGGFN